MRHFKTVLAGAAGMLVLAGCQYMDKSADAMVEAEAEAQAEAALDTAALEAIVDAQPDEVKARYDARNPAETIAFFGLEPGMTVAEALPGGGWYTKILLPYLGPEGTLIGAHYPDEMWQHFGGAAGRTEDRIKATAEWPARAAEWEIETPAKIKSVQLTKMPEEATGKVDAVLFIRALHNLNRFEDKGEFMSKTLAETYRVLKPGGIVGVVQHRAPETNSDEWANGAAGYLKQSYVVSAFEDAGFVLEADSEINANPKDQPTEESFVWRLSPTLAGTDEGTPERAAMEAVGESDRMTLRFRKPA